MDSLKNEVLVISGNTPVVFIMQELPDSIFDQAAGIQCSDYLQKSLNKPSLEATIRMAMKKHKHRSNRILK